MQRTPREKDKLLFAMAAEAARKRLARGVKLNHPETIALITDYVVEPKLRSAVVDGDPNEMPRMPELTWRDKLGMILGLLSIVICGGLLTAWAVMPDSALQATPPAGETWKLYQRLTSLNKAAPARLMGSIVPLIFIFFLIPGLVHGFASGTFKTHRDAIKGMSKAMESMGYYLVLVFFAALFIASFSQSVRVRSAGHSHLGMDAQSWS